LAGAVGRDLDHDMDRAIASDVDRLRALVRRLARDFGEASDNLFDATVNFVGADLTMADLGRVDMVGIRWSADTRWPTPEWAERIRSSSVEDPPGSGAFIVLPGEGRDVAERGSPAPIS
jgi:hypothetical protein